MPRVSREQWASLCAAAGVPETETDVGKVIDAAKQRLGARRFDPRRRDQVIAAAVAAGKFGVGRAPFYASLWETDPQGTERLITNLAAIGSSSSPAALDYPDPHELGDVAHLFPPSSRSEQEARWRWEDSQTEAAAGGLTDAEYEALFGPDK
jgi:hypothetical protein